MKGYEKYIPFKPQPIEHRTWPDNLITPPSGAPWI